MKPEPKTTHSIISEVLKDETQAPQTYQELKKAIKEEYPKDKTSAKQLDEIIADEKRHGKTVKKLATKFDKEEINMPIMEKDEASEHRMKEAMKHKDVLGAGAEKRRELNLTPKEKFHVVMDEFKKGTLHSGDGEIVKDRPQALAIAFSESRKAAHKGKSIKEKAGEMRGKIHASMHSGKGKVKWHNGHIDVEDSSGITHHNIPEGEMEYKPSGIGGQKGLSIKAKVHLHGHSGFKAPSGVGRAPRFAIPKGIIETNWNPKLKKVARKNIRKFGVEDGMKKTKKVAGFAGWKM